MAKKYVYVLEHFEAKQPTVVGIFESRKKAEKTLKKLPKRYSYAVYELPLNKILTTGKKLKDEQGLFQHWHYGTNEVEFTDLSEDGEVVNTGTTEIFEWPK